jgi:hypothetical protein
MIVLLHDAKIIRIGNRSTTLTHTFLKELMMIINHVLTAAAIVFSVACSSWAASPDQVGTWLGTAKVVTFTAGSKSVSKRPIQIEIAADDSTTITVSGVVQSVDTSGYNATDAFIIYGTPPGGVDAFIATFSFKNTTMKGTSVGVTVGGSSISSTSEAKYKLKKQ